MRCGSCIHAIKIFKNTGNLHPIDTLIFKCSAGHRRETCTYFSGGATQSVEEVPWIPAEEKKNDFLSQEDVDKLIQESAVRGG